MKEATDEGIKESIKRNKNYTFEEFYKERPFDQDGWRTSAFEYAGMIFGALLFYYAHEACILKTSLWKTIREKAILVDDIQYLDKEQSKDTLICLSGDLAVNGPAFDKETLIGGWEGCAKITVDTGKGPRETFAQSLTIGGVTIEKMDGISSETFKNLRNNLDRRDILKINKPAAQRLDAKFKVTESGMDWIIKPKSYVRI